MDILMHLAQINEIEKQNLMYTLVKNTSFMYNEYEKGAIRIAKGSPQLNVTYQKFGKEHSLIMGAFRNQQYDTVRWLKNHGCRLTHEEQDEINMEYMRIKTIELLASDIFKS